MAYTSAKKMWRTFRIGWWSILRARFFEYPLWAIFYITRRCNFNCNYCYFKDNQKPELSTETAKKVIDKIYSMGSRALSFIGGEPTIRKDFCELVAYAHDRGLFTYFTTNGSLLNSKYIDKLGGAGIDGISVSLDSIFVFKDSQKDYPHNKEILKILQNASNKYGFGLTISLVLTKKNLGSVVETVKFIDKNKIHATITYLGDNTYNNAPEDRSLYCQNSADKQELINVIDELIVLKKQGARIIDPIAYYQEMKRYILGHTDWNCRAGAYYYSVDCDGSVMLCSNLAPYQENILTIDKSYFKRKLHAIQDMKAWCQTKCFTNCSFTTSYMIRHPFKAFFLAK